MQIHLLETMNGAEQAGGLAVVIDVFRAFTTACYAVEAGAENIICVSSLEQARALKAEHPEWLLMGERDAIPPEDFDFGNSPARIAQADITGKTLVFTTSAGTKGLDAVFKAGAKEVITGAFVNALAVAEYIRHSEQDEVCLVAMGTAGETRSPEDTMCAMYLKNAVEGYPNSFESLREYFKTAESAAKFFDPAAEYAPLEDYDHCMDLDRFRFVLRAELDEQRHIRLVPVGS